MKEAGEQQPIFIGMINNIIAEKKKDKRERRRL